VVVKLINEHPGGASKTISRLVFVRRLRKGGGWGILRCLVALVGNILVGNFRSFHGSG
jgi:hypothetical protein